MKLTIPLSNQQLTTLIELVDAEQVHETTDENNEYYNELRRTLINLKEFSPEDVENCITDGNDYRDCVDYMVQTMGQAGEYASRHEYTPSFELTAQDVVNQHTPMPPGYPNEST